MLYSFASLTESVSHFKYLPSVLPLTGIATASASAPSLIASIGVAINSETRSSTVKQPPCTINAA